MKVILAIALVSMLVSGCAKSSAEGFALGRITGYPTGLRVSMGTPAPDFQFTDANGQDSSLSQLRGKVVLLNFWRTNCPACVAEMPLIQKAYQDWSARGVEVIAINLGEDEATVGDFLAKNSYSFPVLLDKEQGLGYIYLAYYLPTSFLIDRNGFIRGAKPGAFASSAEIDTGLSRLVSS